MMNPHSIAAVVLSIALTGCTTTTVSSNRPAVPETDGPRTVEHAVASDPCAAHLHDIAGAMLLYFAIHRDLPKSLDDLKSLTDFESPLDSTCPASKQTYVYVPGGLETPGKSKFIILHDAAPSHRGSRWCILIEPAKGRAAPSMEVLQVPEPIFRGYLPRNAN